MMEVLMLTRADHANTGWRFAQCLKRLGLEVVCFKAQQHPFKYPIQMPVHKALANAKRTSVAPTVLNAPEMESWIKKAHVIHFHATTFIDTGADLKNKQVVVQHAGDNYRKNPEGANELFNPMADKTIIQYPSLMGLGAKDEELIYYPVDTSLLMPGVKSVNVGLVRIGHWPSSPARKGTAKILKAIDILEKHPASKHRFIYIGTNSVKKGKDIVSWIKHLDRIRACDILIERCQTDDGHAEWANTALEAASLGKIVVTNTLSSELYQKEYGDRCPFFIANSVNDLVATLKTLVCLPKNKLLDLGMEARAWAVRNHSIQATAKRLWEKVYKEFFN